MHIADHHQITIDLQTVTLSNLQKVIFSPQNYTVQLSAATQESILAGRNFLEQKLTPDSPPIYGINTGFGAMCNHLINYEDTTALQANLVRSHACGLGKEVPQDVVKLMLLLKIQSLAYGNSGITLEVVQRLIALFNHQILPVIYQQGSLGASGDLAPLAHLSLALMGEGEVYFEGKKQATQAVYAQLGWTPLQFKAKEGLALLNGTQFMSAYGVWCILHAQRLSQWADALAALSLDAFDGRTEPFDDLLHQIRPHQGQIATAKAIRTWLKGSEIAQQAKQQVQDPYSFRCVPQVHGASKDALAYCEQVFTTEINSVTDNPNIFPEDNKILSGGNFHGQPLALALDFLAIAVAELANISERRIYQLISGQRQLPAFLVASSGLHSGMMIPQYTAASIVSQNKQFCTPASVDSIVSSNGQEDHVSMGANAAVKAYAVVENVEKVLAIELLVATQALEFRRPLRTSPALESIVENYRQTVPFVATDRYLHEDLVKSIAFLQGNWVKVDY
jgi:histidine ammonia-lyase